MENEQQQIVKNRVESNEGKGEEATRVDDEIKKNETGNERKRRGKGKGIETKIGATGKWRMEMSREATRIGKNIRDEVQKRKRKRKENKRRN